MKALALLDTRRQPRLVCRPETRLSPRVPRFETVVLSLNAPPALPFVATSRFAISAPARIST